MKNPWTQNDKKTVKRLILSGQSYSEIGSTIGRSRGSIARLVQKLREEDQLEQTSLKVKLWTEDDIQKASEMWSLDYSIASIATALNRTKSTVNNLMANNREIFPKKGRKRVTSEQNLQQRWFRDKPTPETVTIQYEYSEIEPPEGALSKPFFCTEVGECVWILQSFWQDTSFDSPCCALPVFDRKGRGLKRSYCQRHYEVSLQNED